MKKSKIILNIKNMNKIILTLILFSISSNISAKEYIYMLSNKEYKERIIVEKSFDCQPPLKKINNECVMNCPEGTNLDIESNSCLYQVINGICGTDNNLITITGNQPSNLCNSGSVINFSNNPLTFNWTCEGIKNDSTKLSGTDVSCLTYKEAICENNYGNCLLGDSNFTSGIGETIVTWNCTNELSIKNCSKPAELGISGVCGSSNGMISLIEPTNNLCSSGISSEIDFLNGEFLWTCQGEIGTQIKSQGQTVNCKTQKTPILSVNSIYTGTGNNLNNEDTLKKAIDGDNSTRTAHWYSTTIGSTVTITYTPDIKVTNGNIQINWHDYANNGNIFELNITVIDQGISKSLRAGNISTQQGFSSAVERSLNYNFTRFDKIIIEMKQTTIAAPYLAIREITIK